ncbi:hypothetical protein [Actinoallomurus sp. NPDC052274]|uniref:hypothetical protein n=1 Tax=Actinoallomurus sp. NPDC052274 TaxID=3155420 RepID=UPI0034398710
MEPTTVVLPRDPFADVQELLSRMTGLIQPAAETEADRPWVPVAEIDENDQIRGISRVHPHGTERRRSRR